MPPVVPIGGQQTIHPNNQTNFTPTQELTDAEKDLVLFRRRRIISARDARDMQRPEWDDIPFIKYYEILKRADDQYVPPRKNAQDTAINLGTIRDKDTSLVEYAQSHDFEPVAQVFDDEDDMLEELAETAEDLLQKSFQLEEYDKAKAKLVYRSMVAFGTALVEDAWWERWVPQKTMQTGSVGDNNAEWVEKLVKVQDGCLAKLWDLRKCYPGDIRKFFMNGPLGQPYFFTVEYESYDMVKQWFGSWDNFKYVPTYVVMSTPEISNAAIFFPGWTLRPVSNNYVEIIRYYDPIANEFSLTLNGVEMLPIMKKKVTDSDGSEKTLVSGFPLTEISPSGAIPFAKYDLEPMHDFFYSKAQPAKMRVSADVENMMVKLFVQMFKQKVKPTLGNKSGRLFGEEATTPGVIINDIREGDLFPVLPQFQGAVPADFSFFEIMKKELDKQSIERTWQGMDSPTQTDETATQDLNDRKAQSLKVAALFDGIIWGNSQLYWLRTYNILRHWTTPISQQIDQERKQIVENYRTVTVPTEIEGGKKAMKKIVFTKDTPKLKKGKKRATLEDSMQIHQKEIDYQKENGGTEVRFVHLHPELLASLRFQWFYNCVPVPNASDPLTYMIFAKQIQDAQMFFGPQSLNVKRLKHRFASITGNDFDTWFLSESELAQQAPQPGTPAAPGAPNTPSPTAQPTIASMAQNKMPTLGPVMK